MAATRTSATRRGMKIRVWAGCVAEIAKRSISADTDGENAGTYKSGVMAPDPIEELPRGGRRARAYGPVRLLPCPPHAARRRNTRVSVTEIDFRKTTGACAEVMPANNDSRRAGIHARESRAIDERAGAYAHV